MQKIYAEGEVNNVQVGMSQITLSDTVVETKEGHVIKKNNPVIVYDTSGAYGDKSYKADFKIGLPHVRKPWFTRRKDIVEHQTGAEGKKNSFFHAKEGKCITQAYYAKKRMITPEMEYVAIRENQQIEALGLKSYITPDFVRKEMASGRAVIPANVNHVTLEPMIIGSRFLVKINGNISLNDVFSESDVEKIRFNCCLGVDSLLDITCGKKSTSASRAYLVRNSPVPVGTPPLYYALEKVEGKVEKLSWDIFRSALIEQLQQGVDFITIHAAMKRKHLKMISNRLTGIASFSGKIIADWMDIHKEENFLNTHFTEICEIASMYDAVISLGSGLRPGSVYDAIDHAQYAELLEMQGLILTAFKSYTQIVVEGAGHIPINKIGPYMKDFHSICKGVPFISSGTVTSDVAVEHEHIAAAISGAQMAWYGASVIGGLKNQITLTDMESILADLVSYKIAAHSADLAKGHPGAQVRDNAFSRAKQEHREEDCVKLSLGGGR